MKHGLLSVFVVLVLVFGSLGASYAIKNGVSFEGTHYDFEFVEVVLTDAELVDYCQGNYLLGADKQSVEVFFDNAYPGYVASVTYRIENLGDVPIAINNIFVLNSCPEALEIDLEYFEPFLLYPHEGFQRTEAVTVLWGAEQNGVYGFEIVLNVDGERNCPGSIGYWKHQFSAYLYGKGKPHVDDDVLEDWLGIVSSDSEVFEFVGTKEEKFLQAFELLDPSKKWTPDDHLRAQLLALWLNRVSGRTIGFTLEGMGCDEVIFGSEQALLSSDVENFEYWKDMCECFDGLSFE